MELQLPTYMQAIKLSATMHQEFSQAAHHSKLITLSLLLAMELMLLAGRTIGLSKTLGEQAGEQMVISRSLEETINVELGNFALLQFAPRPLVHLVTHLSYHLHLQFHLLQLAI
ncbi:hypothetical protein FGO68_gene10347 [Halteria grandinella]|uniref:Uncharacterized protein n=1 Tax=Halteria grandinella TaxID=5974 RepID=A0A8J8NST5_HALGN|nr:hypothetical protein FGO68_gene10347 [Halteria grandinella]